MSNRLTVKFNETEVITGSKIPKDLRDARQNSVEEYRQQKLKFIDLLTTNGGEYDVKSETD